MAKVTLPGKSRISGAKAFWAIAVIAALAVAGGVFLSLSKLSETVTYFVINESIAPRTQITPNMMEPVVTSKGGEPRNSFTPADVVSGDVYSKYTINIGDIITESNAGAITPINEGIPEDFTVMSFTADAATAVAGRVKRGDHVDVIGTAETEDGLLTRYVLRNVYILEVNSSLGNVGDIEDEEGGYDPGEGATASDTSGARAGVPAVYTVGLSQDDALTLAAARGDNLMITLSPLSYLKDGAPDTDTVVNHREIYDSFWRTGDSGVGTGVIDPNADLKPGDEGYVDPNADLKPGDEGYVDPEVSGNGEDNPDSEPAVESESTE